MTDGMANQEGSHLPYFSSLIIASLEIVESMKKG